jgi:hypothetical protein
MFLVTLRGITPQRLLFVQLLQATEQRQDGQSMQFMHQIIFQESLIVDIMQCSSMTLCHSFKKKQEEKTYICCCRLTYFFMYFANKKKEFFAFEILVHLFIFLQTGFLFFPPHLHSVIDRIVQHWFS